jgi:hypothetical protein
MNREYASALPYTDEERQRDDESRQRVLNIIGNRRKVLRSGQNYNVPGDKASKSKDERILGEAS